MKNTNYTKNMYQYLSWRVFQKVFGEVEWCQEEEKIIAGLAEEASWKLTESGMTERLVDPYKSSAPYGEGYCHKRKKVRKFRFDRVIDIKLTDKNLKN